MTREALWGAALALALAVPASAETQTYFGFEIGIGNAPPPPIVRFREEPDVVFVPTNRVYVVRSYDDYDMFRYGRYYYVCDDGYWYRARSHQGPFRVIDVRHVPRTVFAVPAKHWKHYWRDREHWRHEQAKHRRHEQEERWKHREKGRR